MSKTYEEIVADGKAAIGKQLDEERAANERCDVYYYGIIRLQPALTSSNKEEHLPAIRQLLQIEQQIRIQGDTEYFPRYLSNEGATLRRSSEQNEAEIRERQKNINTIWNGDSESKRSAQRTLDDRILSSRTSFAQQFENLAFVRGITVMMLSAKP